MRVVQGVHWSNGPQWDNEQALRAELGRVLDALNAQDAAEAEVRLDEALSYAATLLMWREAIK